MGRSRQPAWTHQRVAVLFEFRYPGTTSSRLVAEELGEHLNRNWVPVRRRSVQACALAIPTLLSCVIGNPQGPPAAQSGSGAVDFASDIQPVLAASCYQCHGAKLQMAGLRLDEKAAALRGGQSGAAIVPGKSKDSLLFKRVSGQGGLARMPMGGKPLTPEQTTAIARWIDSGAVWPDAARASASPKRAEHWAFIPPVRPPVPSVSTSAWVKNPIDAFVLAKLDQEHLAPSAEADRVPLLRRLSLDLIGLPPTIEEVNAYVADKSDRAYEKQVERLLASPHYGERWGRVWLDAARYADSNGFEKDAPRSVWAYRDWVINALNHDLPYDQFVIQQIAGDLLPNQPRISWSPRGFSETPA